MRLSFLDQLALAIRAGEKTETRRLVVPRVGKRIRPCAGWEASARLAMGGYLHVPVEWLDESGRVVDKAVERVGPDGRPGDEMQVCEALVARGEGVGPDRACYRADGALVDGRLWPWKVRTLPARYCPSWAVRTKRVLTEVRAERLSEITDAGAVAEGIARLGWEPTRESFLRGFRQLHELAGDADPWVWVYRWDNDGGDR